MASGETDQLKNIAGVLIVQLAAAISKKLEKHGSALDPYYSELLRTLASTANSPTWMMLYHFTIDGCVLAAIWLSSAIVS